MTDEEMESCINQLLPTWANCSLHKWPSVALRAKYNFPDPTVLASKRVREVAECGIPVPQDLTIKNKRRIFGLVLESMHNLLDARSREASAEEAA